LVQKLYPLYSKKLYILSKRHNLLVKNDKICLDQKGNINMFTWEEDYIEEEDSYAPLFLQIQEKKENDSSILPSVMCACCNTFFQEHGGLKQEIEAAWNEQMKDFPYCALQEKWLAYYTAGRDFFIAYIEPEGRIEEVFFENTLEQAASNQSKKLYENDSEKEAKKLAFILGAKHAQYAYADSIFRRMWGYELSEPNSPYKGLAGILKRAMQQLLIQESMQEERKLSYKYAPAFCVRQFPFIHFDQILQKQKRQGTDDQDSLNHALIHFIHDDFYILPVSQITDLYFQIVQSLFEQENLMENPGVLSALHCMADTLFENKGLENYLRLQLGDKSIETPNLALEDDVLESLSLTGLNPNAILSVLLGLGLHTYLESIKLRYEDTGKQNPSAFELIEQFLQGQIEPFFQ
jgi:hypothetical protein